MIFRYVGLGRQDATSAVRSKLHFDVNSISLDSPKKSLQEIKSGLARGKTKLVPVAYSTEGGFTVASDVVGLSYLLYAFCGEANRVSTGVTLVTNENLGTPSDGVLSGTLTHNPVCIGQIIFNQGGSPIAIALASGAIYGVTAISAEEHTVEEDTAFYLDNGRVGILTVVIKVGGDTVAQDNGLGVLTEVGSSGITGTIDYLTGRIVLDGIGETALDITVDYATVNTAQARGRLNYMTGEYRLSGISNVATTANYAYGTYTYTLTPQSNAELATYTIRTGKDRYEHGFLNCGLNELSIGVDKGVAEVEVSVVGGADFRATIPTSVTQLNLLDLPLIAFYNTSIAMASYGETPSTSYSARLKSLKISFSNDIDSEYSLTLSSRYPERIFAGGLVSELEATAIYDDLTFRTLFWGAESAPSTTPNYRAITITLTTTGLGTITITYPKCLITTLAHQPKGSDLLEEDLTIQPVYDDTTGQLFTIASSIPLLI